jgi:hypothetical protein
LVSERKDHDARILLKRNGRYEHAGVNFDAERGKVWLFLENGDALCVEAPRLRSMVEKYQRQLQESGLPPRTDDGYPR